MKNKKEDLHTKFKKTKKSVQKDMWPAVSTFANTDGGTRTIICDSLE